MLSTFVDMYTRYLRLTHYVPPSPACARHEASPNPNKGAGEWEEFQDSKKHTNIDGQHGCFKNRIQYLNTLRLLNGLSCCLVKKKLFEVRQLLHTESMFNRIVANLLTHDIQPGWGLQIWIKNPFIRLQNSSKFKGFRLFLYKVIHDGLTLHLFLC